MENPKRNVQENEHNNIRARFYPTGFNAEVAVTDEDEVHLFSEEGETIVSLDTCEEIQDILEHVHQLVGDSDDALENIQAFTGIFKFLAATGENSYLNPTAPGDASYGVGADPEAEPAEPTSRSDQRRGD